MEKSDTPSTRNLFQTVEKSSLLKNCTSLVTERAQYFSSAVYCRFQPDCDFWTNLPSGCFSAPSGTSSMVRQILRFLVASPFSSLAGRSQVHRNEPRGEKLSSKTAERGSEVNTWPTEASTTTTLSLAAYAK